MVRKSCIVDWNIDSCWPSKDTDPVCFLLAISPQLTKLIQAAGDAPKGHGGTSQKKEYALVALVHIESIESLFESMLGFVAKQPDFWNFPSHFENSLRATKVNLLLGLATVQHHQENNIVGLI